MLNSILEFIENLETFYKGKDVNDLLRDLESSYQPLKNAEQLLFFEKEKIKHEKFSLLKNLDIVEFLLEIKNEVCLNFRLSYDIYARAKLKALETTLISLGANIIVGYELEEAKIFLKKNLIKTHQKLEIISKNLNDISDKKKITEITVAKLYNLNKLI